MKRIFSVLAVTGLMAAGCPVAATAAFADPPPITGGGSQGEGATVLHCGPFFEEFLDIPGVEGNVADTPNGELRGSGCRNAP